MTNKVTIVIPVYKDWATLKLCIESLKKHLDSRHTVMLVNDISPEADEIEGNIKNAIVGQQNFVYFRNPENMGFVRTCNRAVFELDETDNDILLLNSDTEVTEGFLEEMLEVLYLAEKHGAVCPRSNCATIFTVPVRNNDSRNITPEESHRCYESTRGLFPRYSIMPTGVGFCILIKRKLIKLYGLFDEIYGLGYNEENDFCMRINQYGWNVVSANKVYVYHYESKSFGTKRAELDAKNHKILIDRYPYYDSIVQSYFTRKMSPIDYFADLIDKEFYKKRRILISLYNLPPVFNGTSIFELSFLKYFQKEFSDKYDIYILINRGGDNFHKVSATYKNVYYPDNITGTFDIAYIPSQIFHIKHLFILNRTCLRFVFCMQDVITLRCGYILNPVWEREEIFRQSIRFADGIVGISDFTIDDTKKYFPALFDSSKVPFRRIYHADWSENKEVSKEPLPFGKYYLVFGNFYKHKMLNEVIPVLKSCNANFIVFGADNDGEITKNIYSYKSGNKANSFINELLAYSTGVIFPSVYEGFGFMNKDAAKFSKPLIVNDNQLNRELFSSCLKDFSKHVYYFKTLEEISKNIAEIEHKENLDEKISINFRTPIEVVKETESFLFEVMETPIDTVRLQERWEYFGYLSSVHRCFAPRAQDLASLRKCIKAKIRQRPLLFKIAKRIKKILKPQGEKK